MNPCKGLIAVGLALALMAPAIAFAGNHNGHGNNGNGDNNGQGGQGGQGGEGGRGGRGGNANSNNSNRNNQSQSQSSTNVNVNQNSNHQGQGQLQGQKQGQSQGQSNSAVGSGNSTSVSFDDKYQAPAVSAPGLTSAPETCMGSTSFGVSGPMAGLSFGSTYKNEDCEKRMYARALNNLGLKDAALAVLAESPTVAAALAKTGFKAAWFRTEKDQAPVVAVSPVSSLVISSDRNHNSP